MLHIRDHSTDWILLLSDRKYVFLDYLETKSAMFGCWNKAEDRPDQFSSDWPTRRNALQIIKHRFWKFLYLCHRCITLPISVHKTGNFPLADEIAGGEPCCCFLSVVPCRNTKTSWGPVRVIAMETLKGKQVWRPNPTLQPAGPLCWLKRSVVSAVSVFFCHAVSVSRGPQCRLGMQLSTPLLKRKTYAARRSQRPHLPQHQSCSVGNHHKNDDRFKVRNDYDGERDQMSNSIWSHVHLYSKLVIGSCDVIKKVADYLSDPFAWSQSPRIWYWAPGVASDFLIC